MALCFSSQTSSTSSILFSGSTNLTRLKGGFSSPTSIAFSSSSSSSNIKININRIRSLTLPTAINFTSRRNFEVQALTEEKNEVLLDNSGGGGGDDFGGTGGRGGGGGGGGDDKEESGGEEFESNKKMAMSMSQKLTLGYAALVGVGGFMGYVKSGSQKSLASGGLSALLLYYVYTQLPTKPAFASAIGLGLSAALLGVMGSRFKKSGKIFPAGVVSLVSLVMTGGYLHGIMRTMH